MVFVMGVKLTIPQVLEDGLTSSIHHDISPNWKQVSNVNNDREHVEQSKHFYQPHHDIMLH